MEKKKTDNFEGLRKAAEKIIRKSKVNLNKTKNKFTDLLEELQVYQVELEMQEEELIRTGRELENIENKYEALYEFAPCGYLTLNKKKEIQETNRKAASLLGVSGKKMIGESLVTFFAPEDQPRLVKYYKNIKQTPNISGLKVHNHPPGVLHVELETHENFQCKSDNIYKTILMDCSDRIKTQLELSKGRTQLESKVTELNKKNVALQELLVQIETRKTEIEEAVTYNAEKLLIPMVIKLRENENKKNSKIFDLLEKSIKQITSQFGQKLDRSFAKLSSKEIQITNMIRSGFTSKQIASSFDISLKTVETHRRNIRKKLDIKNREVNLASYLNSI